MRPAANDSSDFALSRASAACVVPRPQREHTQSGIGVER